jgi:iron complex transport system substrate-binding protein
MVSRAALVVGFALLGSSNCAVAAGRDADTPAAPVRIMSLNLCADQLLMALVPARRIVSITWLSHTEGDPVLRPIAQTIPGNRGSAEEVLALQPDLVVAGRYTTTATRQLLRQVGVPLLELDAVSDWQGVRRVTRELARAVGAAPRAEELLAQMDATLLRLQVQRMQSPLRVLGWGGSGTDVPGRDTLFNTILEAAGAINIAAAEQGLRSYDLESVLQSRPEVLMRGAAYGDQPALRSFAATHPVLRKAVGNRMLTYPDAVYSCGVPRAAQVAAELATELAAMRVH